MYGPFIPGTKIAKNDFFGPSTVGLFWQAVLPDGGSSVTIGREKHTIAPFNVDVRDVACAHVLALTAPLASEVGRKRIIVTVFDRSFVHLPLFHDLLPQLENFCPKNYMAAFYPMSSTIWYENKSLNWFVEGWNRWRSKSQKCHAWRSFAQWQSQSTCCKYPLFCIVTIVLSHLFFTVVLYHTQGYHIQKYDMKYLW